MCVCVVICVYVSVGLHLCLCEYRHSYVMAYMSRSEDNLTSSPTLLSLPLV